MAKLCGIELTDFITNAQDKTIASATINVDAHPVAQVRGSEGSLGQTLSIIDRRVSAQKLMQILSSQTEIDPETKATISFYSFLCALTSAEEIFNNYASTGNGTLMFAIIPEVCGFYFAVPPSGLDDETALNNFKEFLDSEKQWLGKKKYVSVLTSPDDFVIGEAIHIEDLFW